MNSERWGWSKSGIVGAVVLALMVVIPAAVPAEENIDLSKAVKIGAGKVMVIEFTDPDCSYCRRAEVYFQGKPQVTRYIYFLPLKSHPESKEKVQYILSSKDKAKAYLEVVAGKFDKKKVGPITAEGIKLQKEHQDIVKSNKVKSTPTFLIYGRVVTGFDVNTLEQLLKQ
jgi:thiol:disulfide interchange protein DsbC